MEINSHLVQSPRSLPAGTVTFLFTDIEGSTELLKMLGDRYSELLAAHREILRAAFEAYGGGEVDTQGDALFYSFPRATDAVAGAVEAQRGLAEHAWPVGVEVRVRMGLHTGEPILEGEGYVGMDVHRAARIAHAGHGGQVLLSETATSLVRDDLPPGIELLDLGRHMLKDMPRPERIHQLRIEGLPANFPPLSSEGSGLTNLPSLVSDLVGREAEIEQIKNLVQENRLVTVTGSGGVGKTSLAIRVASDMAPLFPDGVWFVELAPISSPEYIVSAISDALAFQVDTHSSNLDPKGQLLDYMRRRRMLVVMDNFEHLMAGTGVVNDILQDTQETRLVITSRERLNLRSEWPVVLSGLSFPANGGSLPAEEYGALKLFCERARQVIPDFDFSGEAMQYVRKICRLVEGMPLGIELAAAWLPTLALRDISQEVEADLDFLSSTQRDMPVEHRSLRAVFDRSWELLAASEQAGFRRLAVFRGGFDRQAAREVAGVPLAMLSTLIAKSLVRRRSEDRYDVHELLRAYAAEKLSASPEDSKMAHEGHARHYTDRLVGLAPSLQSEAGRAERGRTRAEMPNLRAAVAWGVSHWEPKRGREILFNFAGVYQALGWHEGSDFFRDLMERLDSGSLRGEGQDGAHELHLSAAAHYVGLASLLGDTETISVCERILPGLAARGMDRERGLTLLSYGIGKEYAGDFQAAKEVIEEALPIIQAQGNVFIIAACQLWLGWVHYELGDFEQAGVLFREALDVSRSAGNSVGEAYALGKMGTFADARQAYQEALGYHRDALRLFEIFGDIAGQGYCLSRMSLSAWGLEDHQGALQYGERGLQAFESVGHRWGISVSYCRIGFALLELGDLAVAVDYFNRAIEGAQEFHYPATVVYGLIGVGACLARSADQEAAGKLLRFGIRYAGTPELYRDIARRYLTEGGVGQAEEAGAQEVPAMDLETAVAFAKGKARRGV